MASYAPVLFAFLALVAQASATFGKVSLSVAACEKSLFKDLCISTLGSTSEAKNGDVFGLANIALTTVTRQAIAIQAHIQLLKKRNTEENIHLRLNDCAENYQSAIGSLKESSDALKRKSLSDVNTLVSAAMTDAASCEDGIKEVRSRLTKLSPLNKKFNGLCSILLTISNLGVGEVRSLDCRLS